MKDGTGAVEQAEVYRHELYLDYVNFFLTLCTEVGPCREAPLLERAAQYVLSEPGARDTSPVFSSFQQAVREGCGDPSADYTKLLSAFIKAAELLETLCVNLFVQPWKKEIQTLKTFTGPFVYCLLPVLSCSTIQSVLASIGYLPHTEPPLSEYRLSEDADPDRAMLVGFELLLARVECYQLLELLEKEQLGPQEWLEVVHRRVGPAPLDQPTPEKTTIQPKEEDRKTEEEGRKEVPLYLKSRIPVNPQPKPRRRHMALDQSIMEMQRTYPDLAFRGRPLLTDKPRQTDRSKQAGPTASTEQYSDESKGAASEPPTGDSVEGTESDAPTVCGEEDSSRPQDVLGEVGSCCCSEGSTAPGDAGSDSNSAGRRRVDAELSHPQAPSLHITLRAGATAEHSLKPGETQPNAVVQKQRAIHPGLPSMSSMDEEQELRGLAERMGQPRVQQAHPERKTGTEAQDSREPGLHTADSPSSSQSDPAQKKQQSQPTVREAGSTEQQLGEHRERAGKAPGEEEQLAQSYVLVQPHKKSHSHV